MRRAGVSPESLFEILRAEEELTDVTLAGAVVDVGLQVGIAGDLPLAFSYESLDPLEQLWLVLLSPAVEERLVVVEDEILMALAEIGSGAVCRKRLRGVRCVWACPPS